MDIIEDIKRDAQALSQELLERVREVERAAQAGASKTQVQAIESAIELVRIDADGLRAKLAVREVAQQQLGAIADLDRALSGIADQCALLAVRAGQLSRSRDGAKRFCSAASEPL